MSIFRQISDLNQVPTGSKVINAEKIAGFYEVAVRTWEPQTDVWALKYGPYMLGLAGSMSAWYGSVYFRKRLRLRNYGFATMYLSNTVLPFLIVNAMQTAYIQKKIFIQRDGCIICTEARAAGIQLFFGLVQPLLLVPASSFLFATRHFTYRIPSPIYYRKDFFRFVKQLYSPLKVPMAINSLLQIGLAMMITHISVKQFRYMNENMLKPKTEDTDDMNDK